MEKLRKKHNISGGKFLLVTVSVVLLASGILSGVTLGQAEQSDRQKIVQQVAEKWIQVGLEQYERRFFSAAEQSFLRAKDYENYLTAAERERLNGLLDKAHRAVAETKRITSDISEAEELLARGQRVKAKELLEGLRGNEFLTEEQRKKVEETLASIKGVPASREADMAEIYNRSVDYYNAGELEKAREGFLKVAESGLMVAPVGSRAEDYLVRIDAALAERMIPTEEVPEPDISEVEKELFGVGDEAAERAGLAPKVERMREEPVVVDKPRVREVEERPVTAVPEVVEERGYIDVINRKQNILRSHTKAVVNDALVKARSFVNQNEFDKARKAIEYAQGVANKNRLYLGEDKFEEYSNELNNLRLRVDESEEARRVYLEDKRVIEAAEEQKRIRDQMAADREKRIAELLDNAYVFQSQQRYEEALGQLQSLLTISPRHNEALILKNTLEDTISFRKQLEVQKETRKEKAQIRIESDKSAIPYAKEINYPKNWREISEKRQEEEAIGQDPADTLVLEQLDEIVDLSELSQDMPLNEAIELLKNSVDPPLRVFVKWRDLYDNADIEPTTPVNMDPISAVRLGSALRFLLDAVSGGFAELGYGIENGVITIATVEEIPSEMVTLVYDVTDLVSRIADFRSSLATGTTAAGGGGGEAAVEFEAEEEDELDRDELAEMQALRVDALIFLIQDTIAPESWSELGGEGTITSYQSRLLSVRQTREIHREIANLLKELRKAQGYQVAIEARFLKVRENFLEDIGLDIDFIYDPHGKWAPIVVEQESSTFTQPSATSVPGTLGGLGAGAPPLDVFTLTTGYGTILDDLQVSFLLRATQGHEDASVVTAPKATVLSGESATIRLERVFQYATDVEFETVEGTAEQDPRLFSEIQYETESIISGTVLNISPTITPDRKHILLNVEARLADFLGFRDQLIDLSVIGSPLDWRLQFPEQEYSVIRTRVNVPDGGTLLLGGQKLSAEVEKEAGVPVLSKIPVLGRAFSNRSKVKDSQVLLILVKPTIILQEEAEAEAIAAIEKGF